MELRQLQYFLMVAQEQSFAKAAKKTYVSQQALSKSVLSLEQELGVPLFDICFACIRRMWHHVADPFKEGLSYYQFGQ